MSWLCLQKNDYNKCNAVSPLSLSPQHSCQSDGNAMYFHGTEGTDFNFVTTRDIDLQTEGIVTQWVEEFESQPAG